LRYLEPAWAISVHKAQGSEFPVVVAVVTTHHFKLLQRHLVYTAVTRARKILVVVGMRRAMQMALDNVSGVVRFTGLAARLGARLERVA
jgi:exodeoxyribonuclease V alpha subunit